MVCFKASGVVLLHTPPDTGFNTKTMPDLDPDELSSLLYLAQEGGGCVGLVVVGPLSPDIWIRNLQHDAPGERIGALLQQLLQSFQSG